MLKFILVGIIIGSLIDVAWRYYFSKYDHDWMIPFEHYHWSIVMFFLSIMIDVKPISGILTGISLILWLDELLFQDHSFAIGSDHFMPSTIIGCLICFLMLLLYWMFLLTPTL